MIKLQYQMRWPAEVERSRHIWGWRSRTHGTARELRLAPASDEDDGDIVSSFYIRYIGGLSHS